MAVTITSGSDISFMHAIHITIRVSPPEIMFKNWENYLYVLNINCKLCTKAT